MQVSGRVDIFPPKLNPEPKLLMQKIIPNPPRSYTATRILPNLWSYKRIMETKTETTRVYRGYIGMMEKQMETTIVYGENGKMETAIVYWDNAEENGNYCSTLG